MTVSVKFCGLTRVDDAATASRLGARYVGAIFAGGPRLVDASHAARLFAAARDATPDSVQSVGVIGSQRASEIARLVDDAGLDVVQLHADPTPSDIAALRASTGARVWAVLRVEGDTLPERAAELFATADAVVLDAKVAGRLGGTGVSLDWEAIADAVNAIRGDTPLVLAGGLTPTNVARASRTIAPDVVDVSSGVEQSPGVKDPQLMRAFVAQLSAS